MMALCFDLDGTLADTDPLHLRAWCEVLNEHGIAADREFYVQKIAGRRNAEIVASLFPHLELAQGLAIADRKEARFRELAKDALSALPGVSDLLAQSARLGWATALVTNAPRANAEQILSAIGLEFPTSVFAEDLERGKPAPDPYLEAVRQLGVQAAHTVAFEDSPSGVRSSVAAGLRTVGILTGHPKEALHAAGASLCIANFNAPELWPWLLDGDAQ
jgi:HAD superfamily hydrolase (TIGR01509 family)